MLGDLVGKSERYLELEGGEGGLMLYSLRDLDEMAEVYEMETYLKGFTAFGDDGGTYVYIVDSKGEIYRVPSGGLLGDIEYVTSIRDDWKTDILKVIENDLKDIESSQCNIVISKGYNGGLRGVREILKCFGENRKALEVKKISDNLPYTVIEGVDLEMAKIRIDELGYYGEGVELEGVS